MKLQLRSPLEGPITITQHFGQNLIDYSTIGLKGHNGLDIVAGTGTLLIAAHDGEVTFTGADGAGGLICVIRTLEKFEYKDTECYFKTIYCHIKKDSFMVHPGDKVKAGDPIAFANNTGMSTGAHLHFGLKPTLPGEQDWAWFNLEQDNGYFGAIDPEPYLLPDVIKFLFLKDMAFGDENNDVKRMQVKLQQMGYFPAAQKCTGFYGKITMKAVRDLLRANGIEASGLRAGPTTRSYLNA